MLSLLIAASILSYVGAQEDPLEALANNIPGVPGEDYPIFAFPPDTSFLCDGQIEGYYADPESDCQTFHICADDGKDSLLKYSFLCPNGTLFNQQYFICDWWFNVDCSQAEEFYSLNADIAAAAAAATIADSNNDADISVNARRGGRSGFEVPDVQSFSGFNGSGRNRKQ